MDDISLYIDYIIVSSFCTPVSSFSLPLQAIAIGFLFVILYYRGGSLFPCIITHSAINITSVFANVVGLTIEKRIIFQLVLFAITITYSFILTKTLPKNQYYDREDN